MKVDRFLQQSWIQRVQGEYVLPAARVLYLLVAGLSLLAAAIGIVAVLIFHIGASRSAKLRPVPDVPPPPAVSVNLNALANGFLPPTNVRGIAVAFTRPISEDTILLYLDADAPHGLAPFPDDFFVLGGPDANLFTRVGVRVNGQVHTGFKPAPELVGQINSQGIGRSYSIRVAAKDAGGTVSEPVILTINLAATAAPVSGPPTVTALEELAKRIALFVDPARTPAYFDAYQRALREPKDCGTSADDANFVGEYGRAFDFMRTRTTRDKIEIFYRDFCGVWRAGVQAQSMAIQQAQMDHARALADSVLEKAGADAIIFAAKLARNASAMAVVIALAIFMFLSLFLAFLAMENHSKAMRETLKSIAKDRE